MADWADNHKTMVLLGVDGEADLHAWAAFLRGAGARLEMFVEPDMGDQATAIAVAPGADPLMFKRLRLL